MTIKKEEATFKAGVSIKDDIDGLTFGEYLRILREEDNITQDELAEKMGCTKQYISNIENGRGSVTTAAAAKIAVALGYFPAPFLQILLNEEIKKIDPAIEVTLTRKIA
jgi:transcriptional regulator with XRE-family HTH domain